MKARCIRLKDVFSSMRFDGGYHNADVNVYDKVIRKHSQHTLDYYCYDIFTSGRTKRVYTGPEYGYPFLSNADVVSANPFQSCKYSSKKYGFDPNAVLKEGMILTGRVGAIGQTAFVPAFIEKAKAMGSDNIIRIVVKPSYKNGFIYAYLASRIGNLAFWKLATGGVQPFITDVMVGKLPIPAFPKSFQAEVDDLIQESARLREEANDMLEEAQNKLIEFCDQPFSKSNGIKYNSIKISNIRKSLNTRFDPPIYINDGVDWMAHIKKETVLLGDIDIKTWYPGIFKRIYVKKGLPYIKGSSVFNINPFRSCDHLSSSRTPMLDELWLTDGLLLITCAGAVGLVKMITKEYEDKGAIGSPDIIRLTSNDSLFTTEYLFTYLQLPAVYDYIQSLKYGSVIERFDIANVETIPVVKPTIGLSEEITVLIKEYKQCMYQAFNAEEKAIKMVEDEIEKWNKAN